LRAFCLWTEAGHRRHVALGVCVGDAVTMTVPSLTARSLAADNYVTPAAVLLSSPSDPEWPL